MRMGRSTRMGRRLLSLGAWQAGGAKPAPRSPRRRSSAAEADATGWGRVAITEVPRHGFANPDIAAASPGAPHSVGRSYARRQPEHSLVHQLVAAEADGVRAAVYRASEHGRGLPRHVDKELDAFLDCGLLHRGFARVVCRRCRSEHLIAFSCKGRGICPSCTSRRMADTAAHLVDRVLPWAPYRQWVVTFSPRVRYHLAADPKLASLALTESLRAIFAWQRRAARRRGERPGRANSTAAISFIHYAESTIMRSRVNGDRTLGDTLRRRARVPTPRWSWSCSA